MPQFTYNGEQVLNYTGINLGGFGLVAVPGQTYELDEMPTDNRWTPSAPSAQAPQSAPEAPVAPATDTPEPSTTTNPETPATSN